MPPEAQPFPTTCPPLRNRWLAAGLALLVPGLGHFYQGRIGKGIVFLTSIGGLFLLGIGLAGTQIIYYRWDDKEWAFPAFAQFFNGVVAWPTLFAKLPADWEQRAADLHFTIGRDAEIARILTTVSGLLNLLVIADALDGPAMGIEEAEHERQAALTAAGSTVDGVGPGVEPLTSTGARG
jgi:TM2 domain-containing membrane protein YozV